jgi:hypothetical protein
MSDIGKQIESKEDDALKQNELAMKRIKLAYLALCALEQHAEADLVEDFGKDAAKSATLHNIKNSSKEAGKHLREALFVLGAEHKDIDELIKLTRLAWKNYARMNAEFYSKK